MAFAHQEGPGWTEMPSIIRLGDTLDFPSAKVFGRVVGISKFKEQPYTHTAKVDRFTEVEIFDPRTCKNVVVSVVNTNIARGAWTLRVNGVRQAHL